MIGYATSNPEMGYDYQWSGVMPEFIANDPAIVAVWYDDGDGERPDWTKYIYEKQVWSFRMNYEIRYLYRGRPGYLEVSAPNRIAALRQARERVNVILGCRQIRD